MSQGNVVDATTGAFSASTSEKHARPASVKARSCVVCRSRKVRCDKQSPCSNCRRANIDCIFPSADRPPRWARRMERLANSAVAANTAAISQDADADADMGVDKVLDRLRNIERVVGELSGQLERTRAAATPPLDTPAASNPNTNTNHLGNLSPAAHSSNEHNQYGRLVSQDASLSRYVSSGFWSRIDDELRGLRIDARDLTGAGSDCSEEDEEDPQGKASSTQELEPTPSERHAFLFRHNLTSPAHKHGDTHPLPSQIPFLLDIFSENVNVFLRIVHMPTVTKMARDLRGSGMTRLTPSNDALMCSIYYAAIVSMEEDDIMTNFGSSKSVLTLKYRLNLEHALAKADFLNAPDLLLVQALAIFLCLAPRHDSPRFVWMMTGLVIRMAQYLGLQRDGDQFEHLFPFQIEMRRRVWWVVCVLDARASEDQGTELTLKSGSFDTRMPLNINDVDLDPESTQKLQERRGVTDMSIPRIYTGILDTTRQLMESGAGGTAVLEGQERLLNEIHQNFEREHPREAIGSKSTAYWVTVTMAQLVMAKLRLLVFLPFLFSSPSKQTSEEIRTRLLLSAIEIAEYNHAMNAEQACRQWRWLYQTCTHWYAIVYLMMEVSRRPWSCIVERAWIALHSRWLIPAQALKDKTPRIWVPLQTLMNRARKHRNSEIQRLRADPQAANKLEREDRRAPLPSSSGPYPHGSSVDMFRERWRQLVVISDGHADSSQTSGAYGTEIAHPLLHMSATSQPRASSSPARDRGNSTSIVTFEPMCLEPAITTDAISEPALGDIVGQSNNDFPTAPIDWLWADADPSVDVFANWDMDSADANMDLDPEVNWYEWVESAKEME